jgi:hypothetical protein
MSHIFNLHKNITFRRVQKKENSEIDEQDEDNAVIKKRSSPNVVFEYLRTLEPSVLLYYLNYDIHNGYSRSWIGMKWIRL